MMTVWGEGGVGVAFEKAVSKEAARVCGGRGFMGIECGGTRVRLRWSGEGVCVGSESPHGVFSDTVGWWNK